MKKRKRIKSCSSPAGQKARRALGRVTDIGDLKLLAAAARERATKLAADRRDARALERWLGLEDGTYRLRDGYMMHAHLLPGEVYSVSAYRGRKHRGAWCTPVGGTKPVWLPWQRSCDIVPADEEQRDSDAADRAQRLGERFSSLLGGES